MNTSSILIIYTGGTIGMVKDEDSGALRPLDTESLFEHIPLLEKFNCRIDFTAFDPLLDSSNINPGHWVKIVDIIEKNYEHYDGFVVLHGSDTMAYTASGLSFMLENLNKPVILTGSQLPLGMIRTDGRENFVTAVEIAAAYAEATPIVPEVAIYFEDHLLRGNRTTKYNAEHFEAFHSGNYPPLAKAGVNIQFNHEALLKPNFKKLRAHRQMETNIAILPLFPGISRQYAESVLTIPGLKGLILHTYGTGNAPAEAWLLELLGKTIGSGITVVNITQCHSGSVEMGKYQTGIALSKTGVLSGHDMTLESALAKLMYLLGAGYETEEIERLINIPLRGELTVR